jgi:Zn-dependent peptidase ImmA (M78 family)
MAKHKLTPQAVAKNLLKIYGTDLPIDVAGIAKAQGITIRMEELEDSVSGLLVIKANLVTLGVNKSHHPNRQRFTIAHELGHFLLHGQDAQAQDAKVFVDDLPVVLFRNQTSSEGTQRQEIEANIFAAALLMPEDIIREQLTLQPIDAFDDVSVKHLATQFGVSVRAITIRLTKLGLLDEW